MVAGSVTLLCGTACKNSVPELTLPHVLGMNRRRRDGGRELALGLGVVPQVLVRVLLVKGDYVAHCKVKSALMSIVSVSFSVPDGI